MDLVQSRMAFAVKESAPLAIFFAIAGLVSFAALVNPFTPRNSAFDLRRNVLACCIYMVVMCCLIWFWLVPHTEQRVYAEALESVKDGDTEAAFRRLESLAQANPAFPEIDYNMAMLYLAKDQYKAAESRLRRGRNRNPGSPNIAFGFACLYAVSKRFSEALAELDMAFRLGFSDCKRIHNEADFELLRGMREFAELMSRQEDKCKSGFR